MTQPRQEKDKEIESSIENFLEEEKIYFIKPEKQSKEDGQKTPDFLLPNHEILIECKHHNSQSTEAKHSTLVKQIIEKIEKKTQDIRKQYCISNFEIKYNEKLISNQQFNDPNNYQNIISQNYEFKKEILKPDEIFGKIDRITKDKTKFDEIINEIIKQIEQKTKLIAEKYKREKINIIIPIENENIHLNICLNIIFVDQKTTSISITTRCKAFWESIRNSNLIKELNEKYNKYNRSHPDYKQILAFSCDDYSYHAYDLGNNKIEDTDFAQFQQDFFKGKNELLAIILFLNNRQDNNKSFKIGCIFSQDKIITSKKNEISNDIQQQPAILKLFADNFDVAFSKNEN
jgi:hypothetical protein